jgi:hypothetical protein
MGLAVVRAMRGRGEGRAGGDRDRAEGGSGDGESETSLHTTRCRHAGAQLKAHALHGASAAVGFHLYLDACRTAVPSIVADYRASAEEDPAGIAAELRALISRSAPE